jgi:hypothetical protein
MNLLELIVCERSGRWAAALRSAVGRTAWARASAPRIFEVRQLDELAAHLDSRSSPMALVEVERERFGDMLIWLARASRANARARFVALMHRSVCEHLAIDTALRRHRRQLVTDALREAGTSEVVTSTLQLGTLLALGRQHALLRSARLDHESARMSISEWAWASLPWQEEYRPVR